MDHRAVFFVGAAIVSFAMIPLADPEHRWVAEVLGVVYLVLALASWLDARGRSR